MGVHALYYVMGDTAHYCLVLFSMVYGGLGMKRERNRNEWKYRICMSLLVFSKEKLQHFQRRSQLGHLPKPCGAHGPWTSTRREATHRGAAEYRAGK